MRDITFLEEDGFGDLGIVIILTAVLSIVGIGIYSGFIGQRESSREDTTAFLNVKSQIYPFNGVDTKTAVEMAHNGGENIPPDNTEIIFEGYLGGQNDPSSKKVTGEISGIKNPQIKPGISGLRIVKVDGEFEAGETVKIVFGVDNSQNFFEVSKIEVVDVSTDTKIYSSDHLPEIFVSGTGPGRGQYGSAGASGKLGYATGGAKDIQNFRNNIKENYLPIPTDIPYEGLFYNYYFDTGKSGECEDLFCPSYSKAVSRDPLSGENEFWMTVGLNSNIKNSEFERKKLNMVLVLDVSGSMSSPLSEYYYDRFGNRKQVENYTGKPKIQLAKEALQTLTQHLKQGDRLGIVLFSGNAHKHLPIEEVSEMDLGSVRSDIMEIRADGSTNMASGMSMASNMLKKYKGEDKTEYGNRIIFLTDAMPNTGETSEGGLLGKMENNAEEGTYTSFVGIGVDFNTEIVDAITSVRGANSFSVHSSEDFEDRMSEDFKYMVTPMVFDLMLDFRSDAFDMQKVYGSTAVEESTNRIMKVNTLFPSPTENGKTKGGIVLLKLNRKSSGENIELEVSYENRTGENLSNTKRVSFSETDPEFFGNTGIRKAVLLSRYADLMKNWMIYERENTSENEIPEDLIEVAGGEGIEPPENIERLLGRWERQSDPLVVSPKYPDKISRFKEHFENEMVEIGDQDLEQEVNILENLVLAGGNSADNFIE